MIQRLESNILNSTNVVHFRTLKKILPPHKILVLIASASRDHKSLAQDSDSHLEPLLLAHTKYEDSSDKTLTSIFAGYVNMNVSKRFCEYAIITNILGVCPFAFNGVARTLKKLRTSKGD